ncbi:hypothetical protein CFAM422_002701 [Trichoderma lentiforme]|uniref:Uncharacterized protein n=1 Tax=Trichoderma lentiforme TaxID=1567552 RepID=A0A9P4XN64_9HYPO|nr:hypothetical protein CFAM422_002701 [Trichoderma lentiforme]
MDMEETRIHMKSGQPIRCLRLPRVAASSDWLFRSTKSLRPGPSAQRSLSASKSHRSGTFLLSDDRSPKLNRQIQESLGRPHASSPAQSVATELKPGSGGAAIVGSPRLAPPERHHSARHSACLYPGATAVDAAKKELQGRIGRSRLGPRMGQQPVRALAYGRLQWDRS